MCILNTGFQNKSLKFKLAVKHKMQQTTIKTVYTRMNLIVRCDKKS